MSAADLQASRISPVGAGSTPSFSFGPLPREDLDHILAHASGLWPQLDGKRIFITGGTGFFGIWLLETFAYADDQLGTKISATVLSRDPSAFLARMPHLAKRTEFNWLQAHPATFAFPDEPHDYLLHLATATSAHLGQTDATAMLKTKLASICHLLDFARHAKVRRMLVTSSGAVYGPQPASLSQTPESYSGAPDPMNPASAYGNGKRLVEQVCALASDLDIVIARCFSFIGPHLPLDARFAAGNFLRDAHAGRTVMIRGDGTPYRSYMHPADLVVWLLSILLRGQKCRAYNVGSDQVVSIHELATSIAALGGVAAQLAGPVRPIAKLRDCYVPDISRARLELDLELRIGLADAISRTAKWLAKHPAPV